jgi:hypothetical protein
MRSEATRKERGGTIESTLTNCSLTGKTSRSVQIAILTAGYKMHSIRGFGGCEKSYTINIGKTLVNVTLISCYNIETSTKEWYLIFAEFTNYIEWSAKQGNYQNVLVTDLR